MDEGDLSLITYRQTIVDPVTSEHSVIPNELGSPEKVITSQTIKKIAEIVGGMKETVRKRKYPTTQAMVNKVTEREDETDPPSSDQRVVTK